MFHKKNWVHRTLTLLLLTCLLPISIANTNSAQALSGLNPDASNQADNDADGIPNVSDDDDDNDGISDFDECDGSEQLTGFATGRRIEIKPSDFGITAGQSGQSYTNLDISDKFGYPASSGTVIISVSNANANTLQTSSVFTSGNNNLSNGEPTVFNISGSLGTYILVGNDLNWYAQDVKTIKTLDGSKLSEPFTSLGLQASNSHWNINISQNSIQITGPENTTFPTCKSNQNGGCEYQSGATGELVSGGFIKNITSDFSVLSTQSQTGLQPVYNLYLNTECDTDHDGIGDRVDTDSDNDGILDKDELDNPSASKEKDKIKGYRKIATSLEIEENPQDRRTNIGIPVTFTANATSKETTTFNEQGSPNYEQGIEQNVNYQWYKSTDNGLTWSKINGATEPTYTINSPNKNDNATKYKVKVTTPHRPDYKETSVATLTVVTDTEPVISASDSTVKQGGVFDPLAGVSASDKEDGDITSSVVVVDNPVDVSVPGVYQVRYKVTDSDGRSAEKVVTVTVVTDTGFIGSSYAKEKTNLAYTGTGSEYIFFISGSLLLLGVSLLCLKSSKRK